MANKKTMIVTGASQGIGAAVVQTFLDRGYNVLATSRNLSKVSLTPSMNLALAGDWRCQPSLGHANRARSHLRNHAAASLGDCSTTMGLKGRQL
jgi:NAD(P)-dependent dehydrogenase (short-subunit alcohol dehydrogenase family)